jgi:YesN/AraC family two-component response regulator
MEAEDPARLVHDAIPEEMEDERFTGTGKGGGPDERQTLLLADDNREMVSCLGNYFSKKYQVRVAFNGKEALSIAREKLPGLIITDLIMPGMDGLELCRKIKSDILINHIPVIILTAKTGTENQISGLSVGADAYVEKPFDFIYLETIVENLLLQREALKKRFTLEVIHSDSPESSKQVDSFIAKAEHIIRDNLANADFSVDELGSGLNMSRSQLFRKFRAILGMSPSDFIRITRLKKAALLLLKDEMGVNQVAYEVGFSNPSHFITAFKKMYGVTPKHYLASKKGLNPS